MMVNVGYRLPSMDDDGYAHFTNMQLQTNDDVRFMFLILDQWHIKETIELDVICLNLINSRIFDEIAVCIVESAKNN